MKEMHYSVIAKSKSTSQCQRSFMYARESSCLYNMKTYFSTAAGSKLPCQQRQALPCGHPSTAHRPSWGQSSSRNRGARNHSIADSTQAKHLLGALRPSVCDVQDKKRMGCLVTEIHHLCVCICLYRCLPRDKSNSRRMAENGAILVSATVCRVQHVKAQNSGIGIVNV